MRIKSIFTTLVGVAIAGGSVYVAKEQLLDTKGAAIASAGSEFVEVIVARTDIIYGQAIDRTVLGTQKWPREALPVGAFIELDKLVPGLAAEKRRAKDRIFAGQIVLASQVSEPGGKVTLVQKLGKNTRAMAIKVDAVTAVGGFVTPGDYVDIVLIQGSGAELNAVTILQNIRVIGVDQQSGETVDAPGVARTITVEVTPEDGQKLALAQSAGTLNLTLRTLDGVVDKPMSMVNLYDLLLQKSPADEADSRPRIRVRRGTAVETVTTN